MKTIVPILTTVSLLAAGCASQSPGEQVATDALAVGTAATIAHELSNGNPVTTIASGVVALGAKRLADNSVQKQRNKDVQAAFDQGLAQGLKTNYWDNQADQARDTASTEAQGTEYLPITAPERIVNGVVVKPSVEYIRVDSPTK